MTNVEFYHTLSGSIKLALVLSLAGPIVGAMVAVARELLRRYKEGEHKEYQML